MTSGPSRAKAQRLMVGRGLDRKHAAGRRHEPIGRRSVIGWLGGAAVALAAAARAQPAHMPRIGALIASSAASADDPLARAIVGPFEAALMEAGWTEGKTIHVEYRFTGGDPNAVAAAASDLVALAPDLIYAVGTPAAEAVHRETNTIPVVFALVVDPVGRGLVKSLARPGGNMTGFDTGTVIVAKAAQLLLEIAPGTATLGLLYNPKTMIYAPPYVAAARQASRPGLSIVPFEVESDRDIDTSLSSLARDGHGALLVMPDAFFGEERAAHIVAEAARLLLPASYLGPRGIANVERGGLMTYTLDTDDMFRQPVGYVTRILKGEKPADLPVQSPTKYHFAINVTTAKALGLTVPPSLFALADQVVQ